MRETLEETGLHVRLTGLVGLYSDTGQPVALAVYAAEVVCGKLTAGHDAQGAAFFDIADMPPLPFPPPSRLPDTGGLAGIPGTVRRPIATRRRTSCFMARTKRRQGEDMTSLLLQNATLIDGTGADARNGVSVLVEDGTIARVGPASELDAPPGADAIDLTGHTLMPGLMDAHVHFGLVGVGGGSHGDDDSLVAYTLGAIENINIALQEGFTTVRDAGGLDPAFARAVDQGLISGPRILPSGSPLSQTGGHGDHPRAATTPPPKSRFRAC